MATRYWVGGTGTWDASDTTHWSSTSGGSGGFSVPGSIDTVFFDGNSGTGTVTLGYNPDVQSINFTGYAGTFDGAGSSYTISLNGAGTIWNMPTSVTLLGSPNINVTGTLSSGRAINFGSSKTYGKITIAGGSPTSVVSFTGAATISELASTRTSAYRISFALSTVFTINTWSVTGTSGNLITVGSDGTGTSTSLSITNRTSGIDYLILRDINGLQKTPVTFYVGANSRLQQQVSGVSAKAPVTDEYIHVLTSGTSWSTPADWNNSSNEIHLFGGGGGGAGGSYSAPNGSGGGGGGGAGYTAATNVTLSGTMSYAIGSVGAGGAANTNGSTGGTTTFNSGAYSAAGGGGGTASTSSPTGGSGGIGANGTGGTGGSGSTSTVAGTGNAGGGGGGAGGPLGNGGSGGNGFASTTSTNVAGGGGGGNGGGTNGGNASSGVGGDGGDNASGVGGGVFSPVAAAFNGGGSNGSTSSLGYPSCGIDIAKAGMGSGGGSGALSTATQTSRYGFFGGGGPGGRVSTVNAASSGSIGGQGGIVIVYNAGSGPTSYSLDGANGSYSITGQTATFTKTTAYALTASHGSYSITGEDATFAYNPAVLTNLETLIKLRSFTEHRRF